jgi:hypothetical protein
MEMKICKKCGRELPLEAFGNLSRNPDGLHDYCKECVNKQQRDDYARRKAKEQGISTEMPMGGGIDALKGFTPRDLLKELKSRGYIWENMYVKRKVLYEDIN